MPARLAPTSYLLPPTSYLLPPTCYLLVQVRAREHLLTDPTSQSKGRALDVSVYDLGHNRFFVNEPLVSVRAYAKRERKAKKVKRSGRLSAPKLGTLTLTLALTLTLTLTLIILYPQMKRWKLVDSIWAPRKVSMGTGSGFRLGLGACSEAQA